MWKKRKAENSLKNHMNIIQGIYAAFLGLFLGYVCEESGTIAAAILFHAVFNLCGTFFNPYMYYHMEQPFFFLLCSGERVPNPAESASSAYACIQSGRSVPIKLIRYWTFGVTTIASVVNSYYQGMPYQAALDELFSVWSSDIHVKNAEQHSLQADGQA